MKKVLVSLPEGIHAIIEKELMGRIGESKSGIIRNIVITYLKEMGYLDKKRRDSFDVKEG